jgi:hypothetical protein
MTHIHDLGGEVIKLETFTKREENSVEKKIYS